MKRINLTWIIIIFFIVGCKQSDTSNNGFITIDITAKYPYKKLVLQDFMDVEYIPLETTDEFLCKGHIQAVGKNYIIAINQNNDGNIYIFDCKGKALKKINRKGQGGEEYLNVLNVTLDENNGEIFVNDMFAKKVIVYDLEGNFIRSFPHKNGLMYIEIYNFDRENLICHDAINDNIARISNAGQSFMLVSKQNGNITKEIQIPFKEKKSILTKFYDEASGMYYTILPSSSLNPIISYYEDYILVELSADTLYRYSPDQTMKPFMVRTPSIQSMEPEGYLFLSMLTDRYYFMETFIKGNGYQADLMYDKQEKALFRYKVYNADYTNDKEAYLKSRPLNSKIPSYQNLEAGELVQNYEKGRLKGKLKEIASKLDPEDNPVIMLIKHKK